MRGWMKQNDKSKYKAFLSWAVTSPRSEMIVAGIYLGTVHVASISLGDAREGVHRMKRAVSQPS